MAEEKNKKKQKKKDDKKTKAFYDWATTGIPVKNKVKLFSDGKSRGPLLARAALKTSACFRMDQHGRVK